MFYVLILSLILSGCFNPQPKSAGVSSPEAVSSQTSSAYGQVVIQNGDRTITFTKMPERVITCNMAATENMLLLGLGDKLVGRNERTNPAEIPLPEIETAFYAIPEIVRTHELAIANEAELMIGQISSFRDNAWGTPELFESKGVNCYVISGTIAEDETIENVYDDIEALGRIFKVEDRAEALINRAKAVVNAVETKTAALGEGDKLKAFVLDTFKGNEIYTTSKGLESNLIELAGGINVTRNHSSARWFNTSIETLVDTNPDVIIINDYGTQTLEEKLAFIRNNPALQDIAAVKNERYIIVPLVEVMQDIRAAATCEFFARNFYPNLFN
ncbi:MAG: ABC transporter substrate-binding protein [Spirochaetaceae bacterium]|jgi:iron complex transport system substrate-binding protein|nr:ABC transporter substrate-binding protein [Spirochaetaceae bacterium]